MALPPPLPFTTLDDAVVVFFYDMYDETACPDDAFIAIDFADSLI